MMPWESWVAVKTVMVHTEQQKNLLKLAIKFEKTWGEQQIWHITLCWHIVSTVSQCTCFIKVVLIKRNHCTLKHSHVKSPLNTKQGVDQSIQDIILTFGLTKLFKPTSAVWPIPSLLFLLVSMVYLQLSQHLSVPAPSVCSPPSLHTPSLHPCQLFWHPALL